MAIKTIYKKFSGILVQTVEAADKETVPYYTCTLNKLYCPVPTYAVKWTAGQAKASAAVDSQMLM